VRHEFVKRLHRRYAAEGIVFPSPPAPPVVIQRPAEES
jgi:hypothetical protein